MNERLLCKCPNSIVTDNVITVLKKHDITFRQHDETKAPHSGIYGPSFGMTIYVFEEDHEKALTLVEPILNPPKGSNSPFCPKCGSEDVRRLERGKYTTSLLLLSIFLFIAPMVYLYFSKGAGNPILRYLAIFVFICSIVIPIVCDRKNADYKCNQCGKRFNRW